MKRLFAGIILFLLAGASQADTKLFYDGFEANNLTAIWTIEGTGGCYRDITAPLAAGAYKFECSNKRYITNKTAISTRGYTNIRFSFSMTADSLEAGEYCQAQYSVDGGITWPVAAEVRDPNDLNNFTTAYNITLPAAAANISNLKIRFRIYGNANNDYMKVDEVCVTGNTDPSTVNNPPTVDAGTDISITLPVTAATLVASATDSDGAISTRLWTQTSGPKTAALSGKTTNSLKISGLTLAGDYVFTFKATDDSGTSSSDTAKVTVLPKPANLPPAVNAGTDVSITLPATAATLVGTATDLDGTIASRLWTQTSGPKTATLSGKTTNNLKVTNLTVAGDYVFTFKATDNSGSSTTDTAKIKVLPVANKAPAVNAGTDVSITLPVTAATLVGTATDSDGTIANMLWTQTGGPKTATLSGQSTNKLSISDLTATGEYVFTFTATDNSGASSSDTAKVVTVLIQQPPENDYPAFNCIPFAIGVAVDDLGWKIWTAENSKNPDNADYQTIMDVGKAVGTRITTAWIMCDMDRSNILAKAEYNKPLAPYNMSTLGTRWDNSWLVNPNDFVLMNLVRENNAFMEFGLHGTTHGHPNASNREVDAEYALISNTMYTSTSWGWTDMDIRAKCFRDLIRQYFTADEMAFPEAFVPPAHAYFYNNNDAQSTGALLSTYGVKYVNGSTYVATTLGQGGTDHGVVFINRAEGANYNWENTATQNATPWYGGWNMFDYPNYPTDAYGWVESHFPNWWGYDAHNRWVTYLQGINNAPDRMLPRNAEACSSQWFYLRNASVSGADGNYTLTIHESMPDTVYTWNLLGTLTIKTPLKGGHVSSASINNGAQIAGYYEDSYDYGYLIISNPANPMGALAKGSYTLTATLGEETMDTYVDMTLKTFNVYGFNTNPTQATVSLKMYGTQDVKVKTLFAPAAVSSDNPNLTVNNWSYSEPFITINVSGRNMNGETGTLTIN